LPLTVCQQNNLDAVYRAIEYRRDEDAARAKTISIFSDWAQGTYGSESDTDIFIICPRATDGTTILEGNDTRLVNVLAELGQSRGIMVFKATLDYARQGIPIYLNAFTPPWVTIQPLDERAVYVFDKDTMYKQRCSLWDIQDRDGQLICSLSTTNRALVLPHNAFTSRPPGHIFFSQNFSVSSCVYL